MTALNILEKYPEATEDQTNQPAIYSLYTAEQVLAFGRDYARIQIEKDRERVKENVKINPFTGAVSKSSIDNTPIELD